jgi:hypothetical protein
MKQTATAIALTPGERHAPETILPTTKLISNWNGRYYRGLETNDFIFFVNYQEGDENGCVMMYRKDGFELASDNYFAYNAMFEILTEEEKNITYITRTMNQNLRHHKKAFPELYEVD